MKQIPVRGSLLALGTFVTGSLAADAIEGNKLFAGWWKGAEQHQVLITVLCVLAFILFFLGLYRYRNDFRSVHLYSLQQGQAVKPHQCVIFFVSPPVITPLFASEEAGVRVGDLELGGLSLDDDIGRLDASMWRWQQMLRGLKPHCECETVRQVWLIGSVDSGQGPSEQGSFRSLAAASSLLQRYCPWAQVRQYAVAVPFEDFNRLKHALEDVINGLLRSGFGSEDIVVDVTGGQKTTSIAGAAVTLGSRVTFQYVQPHAPNNVLSFDLAVQSQAAV